MRAGETGRERREREEGERGRHMAQPAGAAAAPADAEAPFGDILYPLDTDLRERVLEIERIIIGIGQDMARLRAGGRTDDLLSQACGKVVAQARAVLSGREKSEFNARRLALIRNSLLTTWRRVHAQLEG